MAQNGFWIEQIDPTTWTEHPIVGGWPSDAGVLIADIDDNGDNDVVLAPSESSGRFSVPNRGSRPKILAAFRKIE